MMLMSGIPSPCGVLVLKFSAHLISLPYCVMQFRPLAGFWFLNFSVISRLTPITLEFRPLAGFWFLNFVCIKQDDGAIELFRPLAGFWFLNYATPYLLAIAQNEIPSPCGVLVLKFFTQGRTLWNWKQTSVPLRGSGS